MAPGTGRHAGVQPTLLRRPDHARRRSDLDRAGARTRRQHHRRPRVGGDARRPIRCGAAGQPFAVRANGERRRPRGGRHTRRGIHAAGAGHSRSPRAGPVGQGALLHPAGREALTHYLVGRAGRISGRPRLRHSRSRGVRRAQWHEAGHSRRRRSVAGGEGTGEGQRAGDSRSAQRSCRSDFDRLASSLENAARLQRAGVRIAFSSGDTPQARLTYASSPAMPSLTACRGSQASPRLPRIPPISLGWVQRADASRWDRSPISCSGAATRSEVSTLADQVWIAGRPIEMKSRQTELRDRYVEKVKAHQAR